MSSIIFKPIPNKPGKPPVLLVDGGNSGQPPTITINGKTYQGKYLNNEGTISQFAFPGLPLGVDGAELSYNGEKQVINTGKRFEGNSISGLQASNGPGSLGSAPSGAGGLNPSQFGAGYAPSFLGGQYPLFKPIATPNYTQYNPAEYAQKYGPVVRSELLKNFNLSSDLALQSVSTALRALKTYQPQAAGLAREQAAVDNAQNQAQRTSQLNTVLPDVEKNLKQQTADAATYASGHLLNSADDFGISLGATGGAADLSTIRGFGDNSTYGKGSQAFANAQQRFQISQYGNTLETQNAQTRAGLELAPTEYINAGQQINTTAGADVNSYVQNYFNQLNNLSQIPASTALQSSVNQSQFSTNEQLDVSKYNASNVYASQLGKFNYLASYANGLADLGTAQVNQNRADAQQQALLAQFNKTQGQAQNAATISQVLQAAGIAPSVIKSVQGLFGGSSGDSTLPTAIADAFGQLPSGGALNYINFSNPSSVGAIISNGIPQFGVDAGQFAIDFGLPSTDIDVSGITPGIDAATGLTL